MAAHGGVNPAAMSKRLWNAVRVALFMLRKGLVSNRNAVADLNLMVKKRAKLLKRALRNLLSHHRKQPRGMAVAGRGLREYEFSCSNNSSPVFFGPSTWKRKRHHRLLQLPCINRSLVQQQEEEGEEEEEEEDEMVTGDGNGEVDDDAEEFIRRFYEQLRLQSRIQYLQYDQDMQFQQDIN
ncbi:uncharacterized protein LOC127799842 [Diospyros lotus]|uniref:uncharacterized protein LOC127799842 n=1 Tax=Diospyros lotus TaxID=55363 RepID=UPI00224E6E19|nr:uncharacterized protein LOC127799842 [Diospyros lotus]